MKWKIGNVSITLVREYQQAVDLRLQGMLPHADPAVIEANAHWLNPHFLTDAGELTVSVHSFVLESQDKTIIVDTCMGNDRILPGYDDMSNLQTPFLSNLEDAGYPPDAVDLVLCTHLHFDHIGWNTRLIDGKWVPTFTNARYLFGRVDYEAWESRHGDAAVTFNDAVRLIYDADLADLVETDHRITEEVWLEPAPGHSPGHMSVRISSKGEDAVITGDVFHHPVQIVAPEWIMVADEDAEQGVATRIEFRSRYGDQPIRIFGTHFGGICTGYIVSDGGSWKLVP
jgi:glyoxylase-like metal-dependent hydrolase (beta-lactamase superfamily II)